MWGGKGRLLAQAAGRPEPPANAYNVGVPTPASVRFDRSVADRLARFVAAHPGLSASAATNMLVDEALRTQDHPMIVFRDGPAGRRARLIGGPDVWEIAQAVSSARRAEPGLRTDALVELVTETSGVSERLVRAAVDYWADYSDEINAWVERADVEAAEAERRWRTERQLLGG